MTYRYPHFIKQNTAPNGATEIGVYNADGNQIATISLGRMTPTTKTKLYSFGLVSDTHLWIVEPSWLANTKFDNALSYFESKDCALCLVCGDITQTGFYVRTDDSDETTQSLDEGQFAKYKEICDKHTIPVYELMGNHESYYSMPISNNLELMETYTGNSELSYTITHGNDLFILCGQPKDAWVMSDADFTWLGETLEANKNKRCFVFVHPYIEEDSGDAMDVRENSIFEYWGTTKKTSFMNLLKQYENVILFHGHSHMKFECQELDVNANYTTRNGFKSVHIPSLGVPRDVDIENKKSVDDRSASQGYIVDVYDDYIVLNGMDFINNQPVPLGVFKIDTPLQTIPAGTFVDDTGTIQT